jgi:hypothetical protein
VARTLPFEVDLWKPQNNYYEMLRTVLPAMLAQSDEYSREWVANFRALGEALNVSVEVQVEVPVAA